MIFATGDTHGNFQRFGTKHFPEQKEMSRSDHVIICGDFGGVWADTPNERYWLDWLEDKPFTTLFVDDNHENFDRLNALPIQKWHGGKVHEIRPHILHLMRGQVFEIEGYTFFTIGGAASHDIWDGILDPASPTFEEDYWLKRRTRQVFRVKGVSWWEQEMLSEDEYAEAVRNLERVGYEADYIITHCAPTSVQQKLNPDFTPDSLTDFLEKVKTKADYHYWLFGHYHDNRAVDEKHILLWEQMVQVI